MDAQTLARFKTRLLDRRQELLSIAGSGAQAAATVELDQSRVGRLSRMDALQGQAMSIEAQRRQQLELTRIDAALRRIEQGEYGDCLSCDERINIKRLELDPSTPLCIACAKEQERDAGAT